MPDAPEFPIYKRYHWVLQNLDDDSSKILAIGRKLSEDMIPSVIAREQETNETMKFFEEVPVPLQWVR